MKKKQDDAEEAEQRRSDILAGKLVETGKTASPGPSTRKSPRNSPLKATETHVDAEKKTASGYVSSSRSRQNESIVWSHFSGGPGAKLKWFWDNTTSPASKRSICLLCNNTVSAASTTNLRQHLQGKHTDLMLKELRADETLEVGKIATLASLKEDFGSVEKYSGPFKVSLDEAFVKWCCKKKKAISMGESDRELRSWILQATRGRYQPPSRKTCQDLILTMRAKADNTTKKLVLGLRQENVLPSISGKQVYCCVLIYFLFLFSRSWLTNHVVMRVMLL
jgi:hypothetical protein